MCALELTDIKTVLVFLIQNPDNDAVCLTTMCEQQTKKMKLEFSPVQPSITLTEMHTSHYLSPLSG